VHNPYRDDLFRRLPDVAKDRDIVFLGRLVSDKGPHVLVDSLSWLSRNGLRPSVSIIGHGPELPILTQRIAELGLTDRVQFCGIQTGDALVRLLNRHRIMVVPSLWDEPFGIVALEGAACGNVVVGSDGGGLPEAIGPCGPLFPKGDAVALGGELRRLLLDDELVAKYVNAAPKHLEHRTASSVVSRYLEIVESCQRAAR
jgi:glycosyltransferase involved in cell wall biosynthesis